MARGRHQESFGTVASIRLFAGTHLSRLRDDFFLHPQHPRCQQFGRITPRPVQPIQTEEPTEIASIETDRRLNLDLDKQHYYDFGSNRAFSPGKRCFCGEGGPHWKVFPHDFADDFPARA